MGMVQLHTAYRDRPGHHNPLQGVIFEQRNDRLAHTPPQICCRSVAIDRIRLWATKHYSTTPAVLIFVLLTFIVSVKTASIKDKRKLRICVDSCVGKPEVPVHEGRLHCTAVAFQRIE